MPWQNGRITKQLERGGGRESEVTLEEVRAPPVEQKAKHQELSVRYYCEMRGTEVGQVTWRERKTNAQTSFSHQHCSEFALVGASKARKKNDKKLSN